MILFAHPIEKYQQLSFLEADENGFRLSRAALPIADSILCDFVDTDKY